MRAKGLRAREKRREDDEAAEGNLGSAQRKGPRVRGPARSANKDDEPARIGEQGASKRDEGADSGDCGS